MTLLNQDSHVQVPVWRPGLQRLFGADTPPVGVEWTFQVPQVPEGVWWRIKAISYRLTTSAVVANRLTHPLYKTGRGGQVYAIGFDAQAIVANADVVIHAHELSPSGGSIGTPGAGQQARHVMPLPYGILVPAGFVVESETYSLDAGDAYTDIRVLAQEYIYVPPVDYISGALSLMADRIIAAVKAGGSVCPLVAGEAVGAPTP